MPYIRYIFLSQGVPEPYRSNRTSIIDNNMFGRITAEPLSASTKKLFDAIDDENLEAFKQALADGANVNAFDAGYTPLMTIIISNRDSPICLKMMMLLLQHQDLNVNIQEPKENNTALHLAFHMGNRSFVQMLFTHPNLNLDIKNNYNNCRGMCESDTPKEYVERIGMRQGKNFSYLTVEIQKAQKGKRLLDALSKRNIYQAKILLNQELNPNCWRRNQNGKIETPLSLIVGLCSKGITENKKEVLVKLLKYKDLDFSQINSIPAIEQNIQLKQIIEQAIKGLLIDAINQKDLDGVKKLVKDNCFMSYAVIAAAFRDVGHPIESITDCLNKKFPAGVGRSLAGMNDIPIDFEEFVQELVDKLEEAKAQLTENGKLNNTREESRIHQIRKESNERGNSPGGKQNNYALTFFILCGICAVGMCLTIVNYPKVSACLAAVALGLFLVGCFLYKGDGKDVGPVSTIDNLQVTSNEQTKSVKPWKKLHYFCF